MKLHNLHADPTSLKWHDEVDEKVPALVWKKWCSESKILTLDRHKRKKLEAVLATDPEFSLNYAQLILNDRFKVGEPAIAKSVYHSYFYAKHILKGSFPAGEKAIAKDARYSYQYAKLVLNAPFPAGEKAIASDRVYSFNYAKNVIGGRFKAGEESMKKDPSIWKYYNDFLAKR